MSRRTLPVDFGEAVELPLVAMPEVRLIPGLENHLRLLDDQDCPGARDLAYSMLAMQSAFADAGLEYDRAANHIGLVQAFEAPGVERTVCDLFHLFASAPPAAGPPRIYDLLAPCFYNMQPFLYVHLAAKAFGLHGFCTSIHNACSSGAFAIEIAAQHIRGGRSEAMIVAGGEAFDSAVRLEWFRRLDLYARYDQMLPFGAEQTGFFVGEGGGAILLESAERAAARGVVPYGRYAGGAFAHQGWKQTIPDLRAARLAPVITAALKEAEVSAAELDLVIPHGAATAISDGYEAACLRTALGNDATAAVATAFKPYFGHTLAACGILEIAAGLLCLRHQAVPAIPAFHRTVGPRTDSVPPMESGKCSLPVPLVSNYTARRVRNVLKLATGFTGHDAALVFTS